MWPVRPEMAAINRRRDAIHIASILYYYYDVSMFSDAFYDQISMELVELQSRNPELATCGYQWEQFRDWDGSTGFHLKPTPYSVKQALLTIEAMEVTNDRRTLPPPA